MEVGDGEAEELCVRDGGVVVDVVEAVFEWVIGGREIDGVGT